MEGLHQGSALQAFPNELLVEILKHLGGQDILAVRQTCKLLFHVSISREVWEALFLRLSDKLPVPPVLERPLIAYSATELERFLTRRISSELRWAHTQKPSELRSPQEYLSPDDRIVLLDGGRWLLIMFDKEDGHYGKVYAMDMSMDFVRQPDSIPSVVDLGIESHSGPAWYMAADMDQNNSSSVTFTLCLTLNFSGLSDGIHLYRLTVEGVGQNARLKSHKIKHLPNSQPDGTSVCRVALRGDYLVRSLEYEDEENSDEYRFEVHNWVLSNDSVQFKACIGGLQFYSNGPDSEFLLLPDGKIIVFTPRDISVYDITNIHPTSIRTKASELPVLQPYWTASLLFTDQLFYSKSCRDSDISRVTVVLDTSVIGLTIPHDISKNPSYERICNTVLADANFACIGISKLFVYKEDMGQGIIHTTGLQWKKDDIYTSLLGVPPEELFRPRQFVLPYEWDDQPLFDESSNRILSFGDDNWIMLDFAHQKFAS